jgi:type I restriction enzyme S subunit
MADSWRDYELGELIELKRGYDLPKANRLDGKIPIISSSGISGFHAQVKVKAPGVVTGRYGTIGEVFYSENDYWPLNTTLYVKDFKGNDAIFIYYLLKTISFSDYSDKGAVPGINRNHVHKAKVRAPICSQIQKLIGEQLFQYEQRIELNKQTNQTLEQMGQALFKSWFVDFDPVFDNAFDAGLSVDDFPDELQHRAILRQQHRSEAMQQDSEAMMPQTPQSTAVLQPHNQQAAQTESDRIRGLFPSEFEQCYDPNVGINGWIPKGWDIKTANDVASVSIGKTPPRKQQEWFSEKREDNVVWVSIRDMGQASTFINDSSEYLTRESISEFNVKIVPKDSVILSFKMTLGRVCIASCNLATNEAIAHFVKPKFGLTKEYIYSYLKGFNYDQLGSTSSIATAVNSKLIKEMPFVVPSVTVLEKHNELVGDIFKKTLQISHHTKNLENIRDTLLPKLISGELTIPTNTEDY